MLLQTSRLLSTPNQNHSEDNLHVGNGKALPILHIGSSRFSAPNKNFSLNNILHVKFCHDNNVFFEFHSTFFVVKDKSTRTILLTGPSNEGLYSLSLPQFRSIPKVAFSAIRASPQVWHQQLAHPHCQLLQPIVSNEQNGLVERRHRHVVETGLTLLAQSSVP
ncbi:hypothetical protein E3N88_06456 [Mikania micrantha]|uniref:GAG-pre-integrase domain-containing protein n=1 Tax=Mikania micrantha TaxID=192012 RepID=A0A5N6PR53_9ASTR|nr:hypothetical protein E3N88_06456 [Mikania micrantha]